MAISWLGRVGEVNYLAGDAPGTLKTIVTAGSYPIGTFIFARSVGYSGFTISDDQPGTAPDVWHQHYNNAVSDGGNQRGIRHGRTRYLGVPYPVGTVITVSNNTAVAPSTDQRMRVVVDAFSGMFRTSGGDPQIQSQTAWTMAADRMTFSTAPISIGSGEIALADFVGHGGFAAEPVNNWAWGTPGGVLANYQGAGSAMARIPSGIGDPTGGSSITGAGTTSNPIYASATITHVGDIRVYRAAPDVYAVRAARGPDRRLVRVQWPYLNGGALQAVRYSDAIPEAAGTAVTIDSGTVTGADCCYFRSSVLVAVYCVGGGIFLRISRDQGGTWGVAVTVVAAGSGFKHVICAPDEKAGVLVIFAHHTASGEWRRITGTVDSNGVLNTFTTPVTHAGSAADAVGDVYRMTDGSFALLYSKTDGSVNLDNSGRKVTAAGGWS